jgi:bifunctional oligoribonuclease and PAP phosphatase NrnA
MTHLFHRLHATIRNADRVLVTVHEKPDGDAAGSATAMITWLESMGKTVTAFCVDPMPGNCRFLDGVHRFTTDAAVFDAPHDLILVLDCGALSRARIEDLVTRIPTRYALACIDHHATNPGYGDIAIVDPNASSTSELVHRFLRTVGAPIDGRIATSVLAGIASDTTNFTNALTDSGVMEISSELVARGARIHDIMRHLWHSHTPDTLRLWGKLLARLKRYDAWNLAVTHVTCEDLEPFGSDLPSGFIDFLMASINDTDIVLVLRERPIGIIRGSFRSTARDISPITTAFGGGGHAKAAGFEIEGPMTIGADGTIVLPERLAGVIENVLGNSREAEAAKL